MRIAPERTPDGHGALPWRGRISHLQGVPQVHVKVRVVVDGELGVVGHGRSLSDLLCGALLVVLGSHEQYRRLDLYTQGGNATLPVGEGGKGGRRGPVGRRGTCNMI